jgi:hypothetical protein
MKDIVSRGEGECMPTHDVQSPVLRAMHPIFLMTSPTIRSGNPAYPVFPLSRTMDHASPVTRSSNPASQVLRTNPGSKHSTIQHKYQDPPPRSTVEIAMCKFPFAPPLAHAKRKLTLPAL